MEIRRWFCFILIKCFIIQCIAKSVSLNEIIAAETKDKLLSGVSSEFNFADSEAKAKTFNKVTAGSRTKQLLKKIHSRKSNGLPKRSSLSKRLVSHANIKRFKTENEIPEDKIISPLRYRKTFLIKSPLKPKKLKLALKPRYKRRNQSTKREISSNVSLEHKYIPLLKSLSMLFDNLVDADESESFEVKRKTYKRNRYYFEDEERSEPSHDYSSTFGDRTTKTRSHKKTTTLTPSFSFEISSDTESFASHENYDYSTLRPHKSISILLPRNTLSFRRDDNGSSQRSSTTYNGDTEGDISRNHGNYKYNTGCAENESCTESDENYTDSVTRNDSSGIRYTRTNGNRNNTRDSKNREGSITNSTAKNESEDDTVGTDQLEIGRNKTKSEDTLRESIRRLPRPVSEDKIAHDERLISQSIQLKEIRKESILNNATNNSASDKRITHKDGPFSAEDEKTSTRNETGIIQLNSRHSVSDSKSLVKKRPVVLIFDGYSVTRDKNGENKVAGKTIHIHS